MKKFIPVIILVLIMAVIGSVFYFNAVFLPEKLKNIVNEKGQEFLYRKISFDAIEYSFGKGIRITNLKIAQKDQPDQILFQAQEISSRIPLIPLLKEKKVIMPEIAIRNFSAHISRERNNEWNFSDLFAVRAPSAEKNFEVLLGRILLHQGRITVSDQRGNFETTTVAVSKADASLSLPQKIHLIFSGKIKASKTSLDLQGDYHLADKSVKLKAQISNLDITQKIFPFLNIETPFKKLFIQEADIDASYSTDKTECHGDITADVKGDMYDVVADGIFQSTGMHFSLGKEHLYLDIDTFLSKKAGLKFKDTINFSGSLNIDKVQTTKEKGKLSFGGNISSTPSSFTINNTAISAEKISINEFLFEQESDEEKKEQIITIKAGLAAPSFSAKINGATIAGDLSAPTFELKSKNEEIKIHLPFRLDNARISKDNIFHAEGGINITPMEITQNKEFLSITGIAECGPINFTLPDKREGEVIPKASFRVIKDHTKLAELTYSVKAELEKGRVSNIMPQINELKNIRGKVNLINETIFFEDLLMNAKGTTISINGEVRTFSKFIANLKIEAKNINIKDWLPMAKQYTEPYGLIIDGITDAAVRLQGSLAGTEKPTFAIEADLQAADISSTKHPYTFKKVNGLLKYKQNFLSWDKLKFQFRDEDYTSSGSLKNFKSPVISLKLQGLGLFLSANAEAVGKEYDISRADIKTNRSALSGQGRITLNKNNPYAEFRINGQIALSDLKRAHPLIKEKIDELKIRGRGTVDLSYKGTLKDPLDSRLTLAYQSEYTSVKNLRFDNLTIQINQPNPKENTFNIVTDFYDGRFTAGGNLHAQDNFPLKIQARGFDINVSKLKADLPLKKGQDIGGTLSASIFLEGPVKKSRDIVGQGRIEIRRGYFSKPNFLKGILGLILNPDYQDTVFTDAKAKLFIRDNKLKLMDIFLKSKAVDLTGHGWVDINKNMDFTISPSFKDSLSIKSALLKSGAEGLLEKYISIHVTGKLGAPQYSSNINPSSIVEDAADIISDGVQGIIKGLGL